MASVDIRQLRDTRSLKAWLKPGKTIELRERDQIIAHIVPQNEKTAPAKWPDFAARRKKIFGDPVLTAVDDFIKDRDRSWPAKLR